MPTKGHIAIDLGAESGRVVLGAVLEGGRLWSRELHRFAHRPLPTPGGLCWDFTGLWLSILDGLRKVPAAAREHDIAPASVGVDTWAVDWSLVNAKGTLIGLPKCYRDPAFPPAYDKVQSTIGADSIYRTTGIQHLPFNTIYQLAAERARDSKRFANDAKLLLMPDLFHWLLSGVLSCERSNASSTQLLDARSGGWSVELIDAIGLPRDLFLPLIDAGSSIGALRDDVASSTGLSPQIRVIAPPTHDTAAAVAAVPAEAGTRWAYLSSGTWSLLGCELTSPCITPESAAANFTNELGVSGTVRFLKNIAGLWLVQECRRQWEREGQAFDYVELTRHAGEATPFRTLVPANHPSFLAPREMVTSIQDYAKRSAQPVPTSPGEVVRCCLESLALEYRRTLQTMSRVLGRAFDVLHIVGGGSKNLLLNQFTADATGCTVQVGPAEGTAIGNLLTQAMGLGIVRDLAAIREVVRRTEPPVRVEPRDSSAWDAASERYEALN